MKFDYNNYDKTFVMHCNSEDEAVVFNDWLVKNGHQGMNRVYWRSDDGGTCYRFKCGAGVLHDTFETYSDDELCMDTFGFKINILEFSDFNWSDDYRCSDVDFSSMNDYGLFD
jgi:hypothetical protein